MVIIQQIGQKVWNLKRVQEKHCQKVNQKNCVKDDTKLLRLKKAYRPSSAIGRCPKIKLRYDFVSKPMEVVCEEIDISDSKSKKYSNIKLGDGFLDKLKKTMEQMDENKNTVVNYENLAELKSRAEGDWLYVGVTDMGYMSEISDNAIPLVTELATEILIGCELDLFF